MTRELGQSLKGSFNWLLLGTVALVCMLGLVNLHSAAKGTGADLALRQGLYMLAGLLLALLLAAIDYRIFDRLAYPLYAFGLLLLLAVLAVGTVAKGGQRWINLGFLNFQPSEAMKVALILALAKYFCYWTDPPEGGFTLRDLINPATPMYPLGAFGAIILFWERDPLPAMGNWRIVLLFISAVWAAVSVLFAFWGGRTKLHHMLSPMILVILPVILIMRQPDLGTALSLFAIAGTMTLFMKVKFKSFLVAVGCLAVVAVAAWFLVLKDYQKDRIANFLSPAEDIKGSGYHAWQSRIAVGSGRVSGKGYGESTQTRFRFLPEQHTDFVFSVWAEEWGFLGSLTLLGLFLLLLVQIINVASSAREKFGVLIGIGVAGLVFWHAFINIGMVIGVLPVVGITLPFWSYGGSAILALMAATGLLLSISFRKNMY